MTDLESVAKGAAMPLACRLGLIAIATFCGLSVAHAASFSAEITTSLAAGDRAERSGHIYAAGDSLRIETADFSGGYFLTDRAQRLAYFVRAADRLFMDARRSSPLTRLLVVVDPDNPCPQWQAMAEIADGNAARGSWRCERIGEKTIDGRPAVVYRASPPEGPGLTGAIDRTLGIPLEVETSDGVHVTVRNVREDTPPAALLAVPAGFRKFDPEALLRRIKQSDVWVEPPK